MATIDVEKITQEFRLEFYAKKFKMGRSRNNGPDYAEDRESRDAKVISDFIGTESFLHICKMK